MHPFIRNPSIQSISIFKWNSREIGSNVWIRAQGRHLSATRVKNRPPDDRPAPTCRPEFFFFKLKKNSGRGDDGAAAAKREATGADCVPPLFCLSSAIFARPLSGGRRTPQRKIQRRHFFFLNFKKKGSNGLIWDTGCSASIMATKQCPTCPAPSDPLGDSMWSSGRVPLMSICCWWGLGTYLTCI